MGETETCGSLSKVAELAADSPVVCDISQIEARILKKCHNISVCPDIEIFWRRFESPTYSFNHDVVIDDIKQSPNLDQELTTYTPPRPLPVLEYKNDVYYGEINNYITSSNLCWRDVQETTLCQSNISDHLVDLAGDYDAVALVIVDGLSYTDWTSYGGEAIPVYVDAPTITECGYPNIVQPPDKTHSIATRLHKRDFPSKRAYTYWEKKQNNLTERLHRPFSPNEVKGDVESFDDVARDLRRRPISKPTYIQITLTGPERVAHQIKEDPYIENQVEPVKDKLTELDDILSNQTDSHLILATADHGILWRMNTSFSVIDDNEYDQNDRRYLSGSAAKRSLPGEVGIKNTHDGTQYFRLLHPYLFNNIRSNEPGVHGGYSCEESIVPLITLEQ
jgi:hypothetical protein